MRSPERSNGLSGDLFLFGQETRAAVDGMMLMQEWDAMAGQFTIRPYQPDDLDEIVHLDEACFAGEFRFSRASMRNFAEERNAITLIAETCAGEIAGFLIVQEEVRNGERHGYVVTLDVASTSRRLGLARQLMEEGERQITLLGVDRLELHVFRGNSGAMEFYETCGYVRGETRRGYYGAGLDAYLYRKLL